MTALAATSVDVVPVLGKWRVWARRPGYEPVEVTWVRGAVTTIGEWTWEDPFGEGTCTLTFPAVTCWEPLGTGELFWLAPEVDFDIVWDGPLPAAYPYSAFVWQGYSEPFEHASQQIQVTLRGFLRQMDNYLAKPEYSSNPIPYEVAIARCWRDRADLRAGELEIVWPSWWNQVYTPKDKPLSALVPTGVAPGSRWTGLLTRETGSWDKLLTSYIQTLLASMYTHRGRWTMATLPGRRVQLLHRDFLTTANASTLVAEPMQPGVKVALSEDHSQKANVVYGQTKALSGESYSGMQVVGDGLRTVYTPLAALRQVHPVDDRNTWLDLSVMRRELQIQAQEGLDATDLMKVGQSQLQVVSEPGFTGAITLESDLRFGDGSVLPRALIREGMSVQIKGFRGDPAGLLVHVVSVSVDLAEDTTTLQVDSKYRDKLTVDEVRLRGRDALATPRMLLTGRLQPILPDNLVPWSYAEGSGYIPSSPSHNARQLFEDMPPEVEFPWTDWTVLRPPGDPSWKHCYIPIGPADLNDASKNWARYATRGGQYGFPIKMSQAGTVRGIQMAAYDADGNVLPVGFHVSLYYQKDASVGDMPKIPAGKIPQGTSFHTGDHYPFFEGAWETYDERGVQRGIEVPVSTGTAGLIIGWGTQTVRAGYWPGRSDAGDAATGLFVDEGTWEWDMVPNVGGMQKINPYAYNDVAPAAGYLYCMIYCDRQLDQPVYFLGRIYRVEPGNQR